MVPLIVSLAFLSTVFAADCFDYSVTTPKVRTDVNGGYSIVTMTI